MLNKKRDKTVGQIASELQKKEDGYTVNALEFGKEWLKKKKYMDKLLNVAEKAKNKFVGDFFVLFLLKKEKLAYRTMHSYFVAEKSCPTPAYDQSVFRYISKEDYLEHMWTVPSVQLCDYMFLNAAFVPPEEWCLLRHILKFKDGTLLHKARVLNGEIND